MSQPVVLGVVAALLGGGAVSVQAAALAQVGRTTGSIRAGLLTYLVGGGVAALLLLVLRVTPAAAATGPSRAAWLAAAGAGARGLAIVSTIAYSAGRVSVAAALAIMLVGQMAAALVIDAAGGSVVAVPVDARRLLGVAAMGLGAWLLLPRVAS
jgi:transporter family-2 protein